MSIARRSVAQQADSRGALTAELVETLAGSAELAALGLERDRVRELRKLDARLVRIARRAALADGLGEALRLLVTGATVVAVLALSVSAHADGRLDRTLIALLGLVSLAAFEAVQPLTESFRELGSTIAAGRRVLELTDRKPLIVDPPDPLPMPASPLPVVLENVRVRYRPHERARAGRLQPPARCGRASRSARTQRRREDDGRPAPAALHRSRAGARHPRRKDLRCHRQEDVRRAIAVAGQDAHLFSATIRENLKLAKTSAGDDELLEALRAARLLEWVEQLPEGLDTLVGEEGRELSGGQRQRLVLARALLTEAPVLVLDEPTAHLDHPTAKRLVEDVFSAAGARAVLLITHRPEGVDLADEVIVLRG